MGIFQQVDFLRAKTNCALFSCLFQTAYVDLALRYGLCHQLAFMYAGSKSCSGNPSPSTMRSLIFHAEKLLISLLMRLLFNFLFSVWLNSTADYRAHTFNITSFH